MGARAGLRMNDAYARQCQGEQLPENDDFNDSRGRIAVALACRLCSGVVVAVACGRCKGLLVKRTATGYFLYLRTKC